MKRYKLEVTIEEGNDEFWESITKEGKTGCNEVLEWVREVLEAQYVDAVAVRLVGFTDEQ